MDMITTRIAGLAKPRARGCPLPQRGAAVGQPTPPVPGAGAVLAAQLGGAVILKRCEELLFAIEMLHEKALHAEDHTALCLSVSFCQGKTTISHHYF